MTGQPLYMLPIDQTDLLRGNVEPLISLLAPILSEPGKAKDHRDRLVPDLSFYDDDPRANSEIPEIRDYVRALHGRMPYFAYFLCSNPATGLFEFYLRCLLEPDRNGAVQSRQALDVLRGITDAVRMFCNRIADSADERVAELICALPTGMLVLVRTCGVLHCNPCCRLWNCWSTNQKIPQGFRRQFSEEPSSCRKVHC